MPVGPHYLSPEGDAIVRAAAKALGDDLKARRALRDTARRLDIDLRAPVPDRRSANDRRVRAERRGAVTVLDEGGNVVIQPRADLARFEQVPVDVTAFRLDDAFRDV